MKGFVILFLNQLKKVTNVTNVRYSFGTKLTSLELDLACDMTHAVCTLNKAISKVLNVSVNHINIS